MSAMWEGGADGTATGPSIIVGTTEVVAYWSDADGLRVDIAGTVDDLDAETARAVAAALLQLAELPGPT